MITIFLNIVLSHLQSSIYSFSPASIEILKVVAVSFAWIGGLALFMLRKDKMKQSKA